MSFARIDPDHHVLFLETRLHRPCGQYGKPYLFSCQPRSDTAPTEEGLQTYSVNTEERTNVDS